MGGGKAARLVNSLRLHWSCGSLRLPPPGIMTWGAFFSTIRQIVKVVGGPENGAHGFLLIFAEFGPLLGNSSDLCCNNHGTMSFSAWFTAR